MFDLVGNPEIRFSQDPAHDVFQCAVDSVSRDYDTEDERRNIKDGRSTVFGNNFTIKFIVFGCQKTLL